MSSVYMEFDLQRLIARMVSDLGRDSKFLCSATGVIPSTDYVFAGLEGGSLAVKCSRGAGRDVLINLGGPLLREDGYFKGAESIQTKIEIPTPTIDFGVTILLGSLATYQAAAPGQPTRASLLRVPVVVRAELTSRLVIQPAAWPDKKGRAVFDDVGGGTGKRTRFAEWLVMEINVIDLFAGSDLPSAAKTEVLRMIGSSEMRRRAINLSPLSAQTASLFKAVVNAGVTVRPADQMLVVRVELEDRYAYTPRRTTSWREFYHGLNGQDDVLGLGRSGDVDLRLAFPHDIVTEILRKRVVRELENPKDPVRIDEAPTVRIKSVGETASKMPKPRIVVDFAGTKEAVCACAVKMVKSFFLTAFTGESLLSDLSFRSTTNVDLSLGPSGVAADGKIYVDFVNKLEVACCAATLEPILIALAPVFHMVRVAVNAAWAEGWIDYETVKEWTDDMPEGPYVYPPGGTDIDGTVGQLFTAGLMLSSAIPTLEAKYNVAVAKALRIIADSSKESGGSGCVTTGEGAFHCDSFMPIPAGDRVWFPS